MKLHRNSLAACVAMLTAASATASVLTPQQALQRALPQVTKIQAQKSASGTAAQSDYQLIKTVTAQSAPAVYLFNSSTRGYLVLSADDVAAPILGYSDGSQAAKNNLPPAMKYWLDQYAAQIAYARNNPNAAQGTQPAKAAGIVRQPISPLTTTHWNQDAPFNDDCPMDNDERCVTGCVATALAQVMKYHAYPTTGTGSLSYTWNSQTLSFNYGETTFQWDDMIDNYTSTATAAQNSAVATLMYANGVGVSMEYSPTESTSSSFSVPTLMVNNYNYDKGIRFLQRDYYGLTEWEDIVYNQLVNYGPVQYSGQSNQGGHSFVCDGYSQDGYFHINWGWGGMSDGYFLLTALDPEEQGIGGSMSGFNFQQDIIANVQKPQPGSTVYNEMVWDGDFDATQSQVTLGQSAQFSGPFYSFSVANISGNMAIKLVNSAGAVQYIDGSEYQDLQPLSGMYTMDVTLPTNLAAGTYTVTPALRTAAGTYQDIPVKISDAQSTEMTVANGTATFTNQTPPSISITDVTEKTPFYLNSKFEITALVTNTGEEEYYNAIEAILVNSDGNVAAVGETISIDLDKGESTTIDYVSTFTQAQQSVTFAAGDYTLYFITADTHKQLSDGYPITMQAATTPQITVTTPVASGDANSMDKNNLVFTTSVSCTEGFFANSLSFVIFPYDPSQTSVRSVDVLTSPTVFVNKGDTEQVTFTGSFSEGVDGGKYFGAVYNGNNPVSSYTYFTLKSSLGADNLAEDLPVVSTEVYTLGGIRVNPNNLMPGQYIQRTTYTNGTVKVTRRLVK